MKKSTKKNAPKAKKPAKAATKAKPAKKGAKAPKATPPAPEATTPPPIVFPATFTTPGGCEFTVTPRAVTLSQGLHEFIFSPARAYQLRKDLTEIDGHALETPIPAGTLVLERGSVARLVPAEYADVIAAILAAKAAAKAAKGK